MINATKGHITNVKDWTEAFNKPLKLKEIPNSGYRRITESGVIDTVSIKRKNPTTHSMGLVTTLNILVTQPTPVLKEAPKVKIDLHQKYHR